MKDLIVLLTSAGSPAFAGAFRALKMNGERNIRVVATDCNPDVYGKFMADDFYVVPTAAEKNYTEEIINLVKKERIDAVIPLSTQENLRLAKDIDLIPVPVLTSNYDSMSRSVDKGLLYTILQQKGQSSLQFVRIKDPNFLMTASKLLGYPKKTVCIKPALGEGSRGFKIIKQDADVCHQFFYDKDVRVMDLSLLKSMIAGNSFRDMVMMDYIEGNEYSVDLLLKDGLFVTGCVRLRKKVVNGISNIGEVVDKPKVLKLAAEIAEGMDLNYNIGVQIIEDGDGELYPIEINPRLQGTTALSVAAGMNLPYLGLKILLGESINVPKAKIGAAMFRYNDELYSELGTYEWKPAILVDFDGVVAEYDGKWRGEEHYGKLTGKEALIELSKEYRILIYTARRKVENVKAFLSSNGVPFDNVLHKPGAIAYIDDRCVVFKDWPSAIAEVKELRRKHDEFFEKKQ